MVCKNCGNIVVKTDQHCKVCGEPILPDAISKSLEKQERTAERIDYLTDRLTNVQAPQKRRYRSRWLLLLVYWIGGYLGLHYAWMGDSDSAWNECKKAIKHFLLCFVGVGIIFVVIDLVIYTINFFAIMFGKYKTDYSGNPIVWFKAGKPELE